MATRQYDVNVTVRIEGVSDLLVLARNIQNRLTRIEAQGEQLMTVGKETRALAQVIDEATNNIAARIERILADSDLTAEEKELFAPIVSELQSLGRDPENPVPPE